MRYRFRRISKWSALVVMLLTLLVAGKDVLGLNVAQRAASSHLYDLVQWEIGNFPDKWVHRISRFLPWARLSDEEKLERVRTYFDLREEVGRLEHEVDRSAAAISPEARADLERDEKELDELKGRRARLRNDVEETLEASISSILEEEGIATWGPFIWPPVDVRLTEPPKLLVTSPRDKIDRKHDVLLRASVTIDDRERVEEDLLEDQNLAALVTNIGGLATYPASLPNDQPLRWTAQTTAHEWLHHFFFFRPLGQNIFSTSDMQTLNETVANIVGNEIGDRAYELLGGVIVEEVPQLATTPPPDTEPDDDEFDFNEEMRETRLRTDELLAEGKIEEAEAYMEERRQKFVENGFPIRKINQAYFAFFGTYADSPSSTSPIAGQLNEFRELTPNLGEFVKRVGSFSSYTEFLDELALLKSQAKAP